VKLRYAVALIVVVDFLVAVTQMQQAIIQRASFVPPSVTTFAQYAVTMTGVTADDVDLYVSDPAGDVCWYGKLQAGPMSLLHDTIPGNTDPVSVGEHELIAVRSSAAGEYIANVHVYSGMAAATMTVQLWDLRGFSKRVVLERKVRVSAQGEQRTAFRWRLNASGDLAGHSLLPADLLKGT
jgi:hypothetical protein